MSKPYDPVNEVQSDIATENTWTRGTDTTITLTDGSDFPSGGGYIRIGDAGSFALMEYTSRSGNVLSGLTPCTLGNVVSTGDTAKEWPSGTEVSRVFVAETEDGFPSKTVGDLTYYVAKTGNDSTGDGSSGSPWLTIAHAWAQIPDIIGLGHTVTLRINAGTYTEDIDFTGKTILGDLIIEAADLSGNPLYAYGTATGGGSNYLDDSGLALPASGLAGIEIWLTDGSGQGQRETVQSTTSTRITIDTSWSTNPASDTEYGCGGAVIISSSSNREIQGGHSVKVYGIRWTTADGDVSVVAGDSNVAFYACVFDCEAYTLVFQGGYNEAFNCWMYCNDKDADDDAYYGVYIMGGYVNLRYCYIESNTGHGNDIGVYVRHGGYFNGYRGSYIEGFDKGVHCNTGGVAGHTSFINFSGCTTNIDPNSGANLTNTSDPAVAF
jgi:hypothetical protein